MVHDDGLWLYKYIYNGKSRFVDVDVFGSQTEMVALMKCRVFGKHRTQMVVCMCVCACFHQSCRPTHGRWLTLTPMVLVQPQLMLIMTGRRRCNSPNHHSIALLMLLP